MRDYGRVHVSFWSSETIRSMSEDGRVLALYLLTSPHATLAGIFRLPDGYVCEDLQWTPERVSIAFSETLSKRFANSCETTKWGWVTKHLEWNPPENPNQRKAAAKLASQIPSNCSWGADFTANYARTIGITVNPCETVPKPFLNQEQEQEQEQNTNTMSGKPRHHDPEKLNGHAKPSLEVLEYLNAKTGREYKPVKANLQLIAARLKDGASIDDCKRVIDRKCQQWLTDSKMQEYLRPATLFNATKFSQYEGESGQNSDPFDGAL